MSFTVGDYDRFSFGKTSGVTQANSTGDFWRWTKVINSDNFLGQVYTSATVAYNSSGTGVGQISSVVYYNSATTIGTLALDYATTAAGIEEIITIYRTVT